MTEITEITDRHTWDSLWGSLEGHPLQSWQWGELKSETGPWAVRRISVSEGGSAIGAAQILIRKLPWPFRNMCYIPRGPVTAPSVPLSTVADACASWCAENTHAVSVKIDPAVTEASLSHRWSPSPTVLISKTAVIPLTGTQEDILRSIHSKKARQYIRKAGREGVSCRPATRSDLPDIMKLYHDTARHDGFALHSDEFYYHAFDCLDGISSIFVAQAEGKTEAFLWNAASAGTAFELWGAVSDKGKKLRANYALKWAAITDAQQRGSRLYDLNGLLNDGISDFKLLWVNGPTYWIGTFDCALNPLAGIWDTAMRLHSRWNQRNDTQKNAAGGQ